MFWYVAVIHLSTRSFIANSSQTLQVWKVLRTKTETVQKAAFRPGTLQILKCQLRTYLLFCVNFDNCIGICQCLVKKHTKNCHTELKFFFLCNNCPKYGNQLKSLTSHKLLHVSLLHVLVRCSDTLEYQKFYSKFLTDLASLVVNCKK
jgi:hypothetical protein